MGTFSLLFPAFPKSRRISGPFGLCIEFRVIGLGSKLKIKQLRDGIFEVNNHSEQKSGEAPLICSDILDYRGLGFRDLGV